MGDLQVSSTTDNQEEVNQAAGAVQVEAEPDQQVDAEPEKPKVQPDGSEKLRKRVDKLTERAKSAEERAEALARELAEARQARASTPPPPQPKPEPEPEPQPEEPVARPKQEDFKTYEEWVEALSDWKVDQKLAKIAEDNAKAEQQAAVNKVISTYNDRVEDFKKEHEDWNEVVGSANVELHQGVLGALYELDNGPEVVYFLANNPDVAKGIRDMNPIKAIAEIGRLAARLEAPPEQKSSNPVTKGPDKLPVSSAPPPIRPLSGHSTKQARSINDEDLSYTEWRKLRDEQVKQRFRR